MGYKVYLDAGHGGADSGAIGVNNVFEKTIALSVAKKVEVNLKYNNIEVRMSRTSDITRSLDYRTSDANKWGADCFVSIHTNSFNKSAHGLETYAYNSKVINLAKCIHSECVASKLYTVDRGVKTANFHVLRETKMNAALIELAFIDSDKDINLLLNKQDEFAEAIARGICRHLGVTYKSPSTKPVTPSTGKVMYQVVVGSYADKNNALAIKADLEKKGYKGVFLDAETIK